MSTESYSIDQHWATSWHSRTLLIGQIKLCKEYFFLSNMSIPNTLRLYQSESCFISSPLTVSSNRGRLSLFQVLPSLQHTNTFNFFSSDCWVFPPSPFILDFSARIRKNKMSFLSTVTFSYIHHEDTYKSCQCWDPVWIHPITNSSALASVTNNSYDFLPRLCKTYWTINSKEVVFRMFVWTAWYAFNFSWHSGSGICVF